MPKISELPAASSLTGSELIPVDQSGTTSKSTASAFAAYANSLGLGIGQTYSDVTASRYLDTTYTNATGKPIFVTVSVNCINISGFNIVVDGAACTYSGNVTRSQNILTASAIIPNGSTYSVATVSGSITLSLWSELS